MGVTVVQVDEKVPQVPFESVADWRSSTVVEVSRPDCESPPSVSQRANAKRLPEVGKFGSLAATLSGKCSSRIAKPPGAIACFG